MSKRRAKTKREKMRELWAEARGIYHQRSVRPDKNRAGIVWHETTIDHRYIGVQDSPDASMNLPVVSPTL